MPEKKEPAGAISIRLGAVLDDLRAMSDKHGVPMQTIVSRAIAKEVERLKTIQPIV